MQIDHGLASASAQVQFALPSEASKLARTVVSFVLESVLEKHLVCGRGIARAHEDIEVTRHAHRRVAVHVLCKHRTFDGQSLDAVLLEGFEDTQELASHAETPLGAETTQTLELVHDLRRHARRSRLSEPSRKQAREPFAAGVRDEQRPITHARRRLRERRGFGERPHERRQGVR